MTRAVKRPPLPSDDKRWRFVEGTMRRHGHSAHSLIETLHTVQEYFGFIDEVALRFVAGSLRLPLSHVFGVSTFYHHFSMRPPGKHACVVCTGTACHIKGAPQLLKKLTAEFGVEPGETTPDGELSVLTARCIGSCGLAPAGVLDGELAGKLAPEDLVVRLKETMKSRPAEVAHAG